jgi:hypothetical protein
MHEQHFWYLNSPESAAKRARWSDDMDFECSITCPVDNGHQRAGKRLPYLDVKLPGGVVQDFVWTWYSECLVQDHVLELFRANDVTGFEVKPVKVAFKRKSSHKPPRLWELVVTGWAGVASEESRIKAVSHCDACDLVTYSVGADFNPRELINTSQWDRSDIFMVWPLPKCIFVTDRIVQLIRDSRLTGANIRTLDGVRIGGPTFCGERLSWYMPEDRARALGEPLGIY